MGNIAIQTTDEPIVTVTDLDSPEDIFAEDLHPVPIDPPAEAYDVPTPVEILNNCDRFDATSIEDQIRAITEADDFPTFQWGDCVSATLNAEEFLHDILGEYKPRYHMIWSSAYNEGILAGHVWVETEVCGQTFVTDFVGGTDQGQYLGFGLEYFTHKASFNGDLESGYRSPSEAVILATSQPVDPKSQEFKDIENLAFENTPMPLYITAQRKIGAAISWILGE
ncbi:MAG: hypothetical protein ABII18_05295 [bacterium]